LALTGASDGSGSEPTTICDPAIPVGNISAATLTAPFGRLERRSQNLAATQLGTIVNRAEPMDLSLVGGAIANSKFMPDGVGDLLGTELGKQLWEIGLAFERVLERWIFSGDGTNAGSASAGAAQFYGLETLVNTGKRDALTNALAPALDSTIIDWGGAMIDASVAVNGKTVNIVELLGSVMKFLTNRAHFTGLTPVQWVIVMPPDMFWELSAIYPCQYNTSGCVVGNSDGQRLVVATGAEQTAMRDNFRNRSFLTINGLPYPVVVSDAVTTAAASEGVSSDIYILPLTAAGMQTLYLEAFDFANGNLQEVAAAIPPSKWTYTNNGAFLWTSDESGFCMNLTAMIQPRLILRASQLAVRITNVVYKSVLPVFSGYADGLYPAPSGGFTTGQYGTTNTKIYPTNV